MVSIYKICGKVILHMPYFVCAIPGVGDAPLSPLLLIRSLALVCCCFGLCVVSVFFFQLVFFIFYFFCLTLSLRPVPNVALLPCRTKLKNEIRLRRGDSTTFETIQFGRLN